jgi:hypothetical protein
MSSFFSTTVPDTANSMNKTGCTDYTQDEIEHHASAAKQPT